MASPYVLWNSQILLGSSDVSSFTGEYTPVIECDMKPARNYAGQGFEIVVPGITRASFNLKGNADVQTGGISTTFGAAQIGSQQVCSIVPNGTAGVAGDACIFTEGRLAKLAMQLGSVGDVAAFDLLMQSDNAPIDGYIGAVLASRTTSGLTGTAVQLGAVPAGKRLWAIQHVTAAAGTNLATTIQSDNASNFPSSATALTFSTVSAIGWQFSSVAGPLTDDWFRVVSTIASVTFSYFVAFGIS